MGQGAQEAFRSRAEPRYFILFYFFPGIGARNHIYFLPLVFTAKVRRRSRPVASRNSTLVQVQICSYLRLCPAVCDSSTSPCPPHPRHPRQSGRARFSQIAWNGATHVRNTLLQPHLSSGSRDKRPQRPRGRDDGGFQGHTGEFLPASFMKLPGSEGVSD